MIEARSTYQNKPAYQYIRESDKLPRCGDVPDDDTAVAKIKLFNPTGSGTWWIAGYDPETGQAFGVAEIQERELGYFDVGELLDFRGTFGLPLERDLYYSPKTLTAILKGR